MHDTAASAGRAEPGHSQPGHRRRFQPGPLDLAADATELRHRFDRDRQDRNQTAVSDHRQRHAQSRVPPHAGAPRSPTCETPGSCRTCTSRRSPTRWPSRLAGWRPAASRSRRNWAPRWAASASAVRTATTATSGRASATIALSRYAGVNVSYSYYQLFIRPIGGVAGAHAARHGSPERPGRRVAVAAAHAPLAEAKCYPVRCIARKTFS